MDAKTAVGCLTDKGMWTSSRFIQIYDKKAKLIANHRNAIRRFADSRENMQGIGN